MYFSYFSFNQVRVRCFPHSDILKQQTSFHLKFIILDHKVDSFEPNIRPLLSFIHGQGHKCLVNGEY